MKDVGVQELADHLGVPRSRVDMWRHRGKLPPAETVLGHPRWKWSDLDGVELPGGITIEAPVSSFDNVVLEATQDTGLTVPQTDHDWEWRTPPPPAGSRSWVNKFQ